MSTITRRKRTSRKLGPHRKFELLFGKIDYDNAYDGYGNGYGTDLTAFISDEMRADWEMHREELMAFWRSGEPTMDLPWLFDWGSPNNLPWEAKQFDKAA